MQRFSKSSDSANDGGARSQQGGLAAQLIWTTDGERARHSNDGVWEVITASELA